MNIITIDRDYLRIMEWVWRGPKEGRGLSGDEEQDARSLALTTLDITQVQLVVTSNDDRVYENGKERLDYLGMMADYIPLDACVFGTLFNDQRLIPESWKEKVNGKIRYIYFDGTTFRDPLGYRYAACLYWRDGRWNWSRGFNRSLGENHLSAVFPISEVIH